MPNKQITQEELAELFRMEYAIDDRCAEIRLRLLNGASIEPGRYAAKPADMHEWTHPGSFIAGFMDLDDTESEYPIKVPAAVSEVVSRLEALEQAETSHRSPEAELVVA